MVYTALELCLVIEEAEVRYVTEALKISPWRSLFTSTYLFFRHYDVGEGNVK